LFALFPRKSISDVTYLTDGNCEFKTVRSEGQGCNIIRRFSEEEMRDKKGHEMRDKERERWYIQRRCRLRILCVVDGR